MNNETSSPTPSAHSSVRTVIYAILLACFSAYLAHPSAVFASVCLVLFLVCSYKIAANKSIFVGIFAICGILFCFLPITSLAAAVSTAAVASAGAAMLYAGKKSGVAYILSVFAAYGVACLLTGSPVTALKVLSPLLATVTLAVCSKKKAPRITAICAVSVSLLVSAAIPFVWELISQYGTDSGKIINELRTGFSDSFVGIFRAMAEIAGVNLEEVLDASDLYALNNMAEMIFPLIPAVIISTTNILAFFISFLHAVIRFSFGFAQERNEAMFRLSSVSAWLYILSTVSFFIAFGESRLALILTFVMGSLNIILTPAFTLVGAVAFTAASRRGRTRPSVFRTVLIIAAVIYFGILLILPIAIYGVITTLRLNKMNGVRTTNTKE